MAWTKFEEIVEIIFDNFVCPGPAVFWGRFRDCLHYSFKLVFIISGSFEPGSIPLEGVNCRFFLARPSYASFPFIGGG